MQLHLQARPPFSLAAVTHSHGWVKLAPFSLDEQTGTLRYVDQLATRRVVPLSIQAAPEGVLVEVEADLSPAEQEEVRRKVNWMLGLEQDFTEFYALAQNESKLAHVVPRVQGRILRSPTLFEDVVKTILTTNTVWGGTIRMAERLVQIYGDPLPEEPARHAFPNPERLASAGAEALGAQVRLGYRAPFVHALAEAVASGSLDLEAFKNSTLPTGQLRKHLLGIKGVGAYATANLLMLLGRYDFLPIDSWALKMVSQEWHAGEPVGPAEVEAAFARWGAWKGLAYWFWNWT